MTLLFLLMFSLLPSAKSQFEKYGVDKKFRLTKAHSSLPYTITYDQKDNGSEITTFKDKEGVLRPEMEFEYWLKKIRLGKVAISDGNGGYSYLGKYERTDRPQTLRLVHNNEQDTILATFEGRVLPAKFLVLFATNSSKQHLKFSHGMRHGLWETWHENGRPRSRILFDLGVCQKIDMWRQDGSPFIESTVNEENGQMKVTVLRENGSIWMVNEYDSGSYPKVFAYNSPNCSNALFANSLRGQYARFEQYHRNGSLESSGTRVHNRSIHERLMKAAEVANKLSEFPHRDSDHINIRTDYDSLGVIEERIYSFQFGRLRYEFDPQGDSTLINEEEMLDVQAEYPGGQTEMYRFMGNYTKYPNEMKERGKQGIVLITFVIGKEGDLVQIGCLDSPHYMLALEAMRVVSLMPKWTPGSENNENVSVQYNLPYRFQLQ